MNRIIPISCATGDGLDDLKITSSDQDLGITGPTVVLGLRSPTMIASRHECPINDPGLSVISNAMWMGEAGNARDGGSDNSMHG